VHIELRWPSDGEGAELARLTAAEHDRAVALAGEGRLRRLWRIPGQRANWGLWEASDATALHTAISSLPLSMACRDRAPAGRAPERPAPAVEG
jgi:muconolactone D-isomerase